MTRYTDEKLRPKAKLFLLVFFTLTLINLLTWASADRRISQEARALCAVVYGLNRQEIQIQNPYGNGYNYTASALCVRHR
jgi:hypothetical protein